MKNFSHLLSHAWSTVFRDQKTFWTLFLLLNGVGIILMIIFYLLWYNSPEWMNSVQVNSQERMPFALYIVASTLVSGFFWFIGMTYLASLFSTKEVKSESIFSQWKNIFAYIGTMISVFLLYIAIWASVAVIFWIIFWIGYLWYNFLEWMNPDIAMVFYILGWAMAFLIVVITVIAAVWISVSINAFSAPAFFLDNHRYFQAPLLSKKVIAGRWWETVWNIFLASVITMAIPFIMVVIESTLALSNIFLSVAIATINWVAAMVLVAFLFSLYMSYREETPFTVSPLQKKIKVIK